MNSKYLTWFFMMVTAACLQAGAGQDASAALRIPIGKPDFSDWSGVSKGRGGEAVFESGAVLVYQYENCGRVNPGMRREVYGDAAGGLRGCI